MDFVKNIYLANVSEDVWSFICSLDDKTKTTEVLLNDYLSDRFISILESNSLFLAPKKPTEKYLEYINFKITKQSTDLMKGRLNSYRDFIKSVVKKNSVLEKRFFFVVPFSPLEMGIGGATGTQYKKEYIIMRAKTSLYPKRDNLLRLLAKIGLRATILQQQELSELFLNLYNPSATGKKLAPVQSYTDVILTN